MFEEFKKDKISINSWIGLLGRRESSFIQNQFVAKNDVSMTAEIFEKFNNPYINELDDVVLSITNKKKFKILETNFIYTVKS